MIDTNEMVATLKDVTTRLGELGIEYMVTGAFAMSGHTTGRMTLDIDVVIEIKAGDAGRFEEKFAEDYYVDAISIRRAVNRGAMFNIINNETLVKIDCIIKKDSTLETEKFARRKRSQIGGVEFWVISKEDLIVSKLEWARGTHSELQFRDIRNLIESGADAALIRKAIIEAGLEETWEAFEKWKIQAAK
ncbi:MAG: nucleotidyltransferase [Pyrinomonadaceae bacterium]|nr:nucleotidyltransferase [Pyrinomonadaceae bacterium]